MKASGFVFSVTLSAAFVLGGCGSSKEDLLQDRVDDLQSQVGQLQDQLHRVKDATDEVRVQAEAVASANSDLSSEVGRFSSEDWQDLVPGVEFAAGDIDSAQSTLSQSVTELEDAAED